MKIAIFGGSFNPIHKGHVQIARYAIDELGLDKLIFVPAYKSPFKNKEIYADAEDRVKMIEMVKPEKTTISEFEIKRKGTSYSIDTVRYFSSKYPEAELYLLIGTDNLYKLHKWRNIEEITEKVKITVFRREGSFSKENIKRFDCKLLNNPLYPFSSTMVRQGEFSNLYPETNEYIGANYLYIKEIMVSMLDPRRHKHSMSVGDYAAKYAKSVGYSARKAWIAGVLHDITKSLPKEWHRAYLASKGIEGIQDFELHSLSSYYWAKDEYKITDKEILNAIRVHTSLDTELSILDKIIYAADKLSEGRRYPGIQKDRDLIFQNFDEGFKSVVNVVYNHLKEKRDPSEEQRKIYERWI